MSRNIQRTEKFRTEKFSQEQKSFQRLLVKLKELLVSALAGSQHCKWPSRDHKGFVMELAEVLLLLFRILFPTVMIAE